MGGRGKEGVREGLNAYMIDSQRHLVTYDWPTCLSDNGKMGGNV